MRHHRLVLSLRVQVGDAGSDVWLLCHQLGLRRDGLAHELEEGDYVPGQTVLCAANRIVVKAVSYYSCSLIVRLASRLQLLEGAVAHALFRALEHVAWVIPQLVTEITQAGLPGLGNQLLSVHEVVTEYATLSSGAHVRVFDERQRLARISTAGLECFVHLLELVLCEHTLTYQPFHAVLNGGQPVAHEAGNVLRADGAA